MVRPERRDEPPRVGTYSGAEPPDDPLTLAAAVLVLLAVAAAAAWIPAARAARIDPVVALRE